MCILILLDLGPFQSCSAIRRPPDQTKIFMWLQQCHSFDIRPCNESTRSEYFKNPEQAAENENQETY